MGIFLFLGLLWKKVAFKWKEVEEVNASKFGGSCIATVVGRNLLKASEEEV